MHITYVLLALTILAGCGDAQNSDRGGFARPPTEVVVASAQVRTIREELEAIGTTKANESITLTAQVTDTVSHVRFEDGDLVEVGDVLVELTNEEETALLAEAQANVQDAELQFNRFNDLLANKSVSQSQVDEAEAKYNAAQAREGGRAFPAAILRQRTARRHHRRDTRQPLRSGAVPVRFRAAAPGRQGEGAGL